MNKQLKEVFTPSGKRLEEITIESVMEGTIPEDDFRITREALERQAIIAEKSGRKQLAENFRRAAELTCIPDQEIVLIYNALRPKRSTKNELIQLLERLDKVYHAQYIAQLVIETIAIYEKRGLLKGV